MANILLRPIKLTLLKDYSTGDGRQSPAAGAVVTCYYEGATSSNSTTIGTSATACPVYNSGALAVGDTVQLNTDSTTTFYVSEITSSTSVKIASNTGSPVGLAIGDRLLVTNRVPTLYNDEAATSARADNTVTADSRGFVQFYTPTLRFDYIMSGSGITSTLVKEELGGWMRGAVTSLNVKDFGGSIQAALDALGGNGGEVFIPLGTYTITSTILVPRYCTVRGEGKNRTIIQTSGSNNFDAFQLCGPGITMSDLTIYGTGVSGTGRGIFMRDPNAVENVCYCNLARIRINNTPSWSIECFGNGVDPGGITFMNYYDDIRCELALSDGNLKVGVGCTTNRFHNCNFLTEVGYAAYIDTAFQTEFEGCTFERTADVQHFVYLTTAFSTVFDACWFEWHLAATDAPTHYFIKTNGVCQNLNIRSGHFVHNDAIYPRLLRTSTTGPVRACYIENPFVYTRGGVTQGTNVDLRHDICCDKSSDEITLIGGEVVDTSYAYLRDITIGGENPNYTYGQSALTRLGQGNAGSRLKVGNLTTSQVNALLNPYGGDVVYDATMQLFKGYINGIGFLPHPPLYIGTTYPGTPKDYYMWVDTTGTPATIKFYFAGAWHGIQLTT